MFKLSLKIGLIALSLFAASGSPALAGPSVILVTPESGLGDHSFSDKMYEGLLAANPRVAPAAGPLPAIPGTVPLPAAWPAGCHFQPRCRYATDQCGAGRIPLAAPQPARLTRCLHSDQLAGAR